MTVHDVDTSTDVDALWTAFLDARRRGDGEMAETIRGRMGVLQEERHLRELDDDALIAQIAHLEEREDGAGQEVDLTTTPPGPVARLSALLDEAARRGL